MNLSENIALILKWSRYNALGVGLSLLISLYTRNTLLIALFGMISFGLYILINRETLGRLKPFGGYANRITFLRFLLLCTVMLFWQLIPDVVSIVLLVLFVSLDGVDGWLARKHNQTTHFGQYFDMEIDALFVLFASLMLYFKDLAIFWILLPGALRYIFVLFTWLMGPSKEKEDRTSYGAIIAVSFFISILISLTFQNIIQAILLYLTGFLIVISFGISFYKYRRA